MKISMIHPTLAYQGGAELSLLWLAGSLAERGHQVTIVAGSVNTSLVQPFQDRVSFISLDRSVAARDWRSLPPDSVVSLKDAEVIVSHSYPSYLWLVSNKDDLPPVLQFCQEPPQSLYAPITQRHFLHPEPGHRSGLLPLLSRLRLWQKHYQSRLYRLDAYDRLAVSRFSGIMANSRFTADNVQRIYGRTARVCHLGIPDYLAAHRLENSTPDRQVLIPGRWSAIKNLDTALRAFALIARQHPGLLQREGVTIIGDGWQEKFLRRKLHRLGLNDYVVLEKQVPHSAMSALYARHHLVLYIPFDEPFGLVAVEAMAAKRALVGSRQGGIQETIIDRQTGRLVDPASLDEITAALIELLQSPETARSMGQAGYQRYLDYFTLSHFTASFLQILEYSSAIDLEHNL